MVRISANPRNISRPQSWGDTLIADEGLPGGLIPIGDTGLYRTPDVVDIDDCDNYPDSPLCGGVPFTTDIASLEASLSVDTCGRAILTVDPALLFFKFPQFRAAYVPEHCRDKKEPIATPPALSSPVRMPASAYSHLKDNRDYIVAMDSTHTEKQPSKVLSVRCGPVSVGCARVQYDTSNTTVGTRYLVYDMFPSLSNDSGGDVQKVWRIRIHETPFSNSQASPVLGDLYSTHPQSRPFIVSGKGFLIKRYLSGNCGQYPETADDFFPGRNAYIPPVFGYQYFIRFVGGPKIETYDVISHSIELSTCREQNATDPPPYPHLEPPCCMACCKPDRRLDEVLALLKKIDKNQGEYPSNFEIWDSDETKQGIQKTQKSITSAREAIRLTTELSNRLSRVIGIDLLPFKLPKTTVEKDNDGGILGDIWDWITPDETETITSIMDFFKWMILNDSANMGQWQRVIEEEGPKPLNPDGTPKVNDKGEELPAEKKKIVLPDVATTLEELIRLNIRTQKQLGLMFDFILKLQLEAAGIKLTAAQTLLTAEDIQQFLDYPTVEKAEGIPLQVSVPNATDSEEVKNDLKKFEEPTKAYVKYDDWTGEFSQQVQMNQVLMLLRKIAANQ